MTVARRLAPLSLSIVLLAGAAQASPATMTATVSSAAPAKREGAFKSAAVAFKDAAKIGVADYQARREAAGPGFFSRMFTKASTAVSTATKNTVTFLKNDWKQTKADARAVHAAVKETGAKMSLAVKEDWKQTKADMHAVGAAVKADWKQTKADVRTMGLAVATGTERAVDAVASIPAKIVEHRADRAEYLAAKADYQKWLSQKNNVKVKTFDTGARSEAGVGITKVTRAVNYTGMAVNGAITAVVPNPASGVAFAAAVAMAPKVSAEVRAAQREASTKTVLFAQSQGRKIRDSRLQRWIAAGIVDGAQLN